MEFISFISLPFHFLKSDYKKNKVIRCDLGIGEQNAMHFSEKKFKKDDKESENRVR